MRSQPFMRSPAPILKMAVLAAAALLDELMGRNRNIAPNDKGSVLNWEDPEYCKLYMVKFCPHDLFINTRADLGQCSKIHDDEVKGLFEKASSYKKNQYVDEFIRFCQSMLNEVERKIGKGKQRLSLIGKAEAACLSPAQTLKNEEQINFLTEKINSLVNEAEQMGIQGNVEQAQGLMKLCDQLKEEREQLKGNNETSHWQQTAELAAAQEKQMEVCDVCGAFLIVGDAQQRIDDHLMGKQHVGYARLKMALEETINERQQQRDDKDSRRDGDKRRDVDRREGDRGKRDAKERDRGKEDRGREERPPREDRSKRERSPKPRDPDPKKPRRSRSPKSGSSSRSKGRRDRDRRPDDRSRYDHRDPSKRDDDRGHRKRDKGSRGGVNGGGASDQRGSRHYQDSRGGGGGGGGNF